MKIDKIAILNDISSDNINLISFLDTFAKFSQNTEDIEEFIKQCKNTRDSSTRRVLVMRHVLVGYELHEDFSKHIGKLVCRRRVKLCNEETELLGTLKASITTT